MDTTDRSLTNGRWELPAHARGVQPGKASMGLLGAGIALAPIVAAHSIRTARRKRGLRRLLP